MAILYKLSWCFYTYLMNKPIQKILFISMSAGAGHKRAAEALFLSCLQKHPDIETRHIDLLDYSSWFFKKTTASLYHFVAQYLPPLYSLAYKSSDYSIFAKMLDKFSTLLEINNLRLRDFIKEYSPDLIIATHFLVPTVIKTTLKNIPLDMVITDYGLHELWLAPNVRNFYVATSDMAELLKQRGLSSFATGLPVHPEFLKEKNTEFLKAKFNLNLDSQTILLMSGGFGLKNQSPLIKKIVANFPQTNLVVISGKGNDTLYQEYKQIKTPINFNYQIIKFTTDVDELIRVSDIVITKPGGITMTECVYLNKKVILTDPIPGQEEINEKYFTTRGLAEKLDPKNPVEQIKKLLASEQKFPIQKQPDPNETILNIALK